MSIIKIANDNSVKMLTAEDQERMLANEQARLEATEDNIRQNQAIRSGVGAGAGAGLGALGGYGVGGFIGDRGSEHRNLSKAEKVMEQRRQRQRFGKRFAGVGGGIGAAAALGTGLLQNRNVNSLLEENRGDSEYYQDVVGSGGGQYHQKMIDDKRIGDRLDQNSARLKGMGLGGALLGAAAGGALKSPKVVDEARNILYGGALGGAAGTLGALPQMSVQPELATRELKSDRMDDLIGAYQQNGYM